MLDGQGTFKHHKKMKWADRTEANQELVYTHIRQDEAGSQSLKMTDMVFLFGVRTVS